MFYIMHQIDRFKINRTHCFPSKIRTVHPIYGKFSGNHIPSMHGISYQFHHYTLKIVEMRAVWKKWWNGFCENVACTGWLFEKETVLFCNISNTNWVMIKYHSLNEAEFMGFNLVHGWVHPVITFLVIGDPRVKLVSFTKCIKSVHSLMTS